MGLTKKFSEKKKFGVKSAKFWGLKCKEEIGIVGQTRNSEKVGAESKFQKKYLKGPVKACHVAQPQLILSLSLPFFSFLRSSLLAVVLRHCAMKASGPSSLPSPPISLVVSPSQIIYPSPAAFFLFSSFLSSISNHDPSHRRIAAVHALEEEDQKVPK